MIKPRVDLDDEHARLLTYDQAHAASVEQSAAVQAISADIAATVVGPDVASDLHPDTAEQFGDDLAADLTYRAALAALSGVVQRSLRDFLS